MMQNLKQLREAKNWSQEALALDTGLARQTISEYECHRGNPRKKSVSKLCEALGCTATELVGF